MTSRTKPVLRYAGAKWSLAPWILSHMPAHTSYIEPFAGSCAVLLAKPPTPHDLVCDTSGEIVTLFRVIRDQPSALATALELTPYARAEYETAYETAEERDVERARRFLVRVWMAHAGKLGSRAGWRMWRKASSDGDNMPALWRDLPERIWPIVARLRDVHIECRDFREVIPMYRTNPEALIYADPPYVRSTLGSDRHYAHDMTDYEHDLLLDLLDAHTGPVLLSGYRSDLYDTRLARWTRVDRQTSVYRGSMRVESLWLNPVAVSRARQLAFPDTAAPL